MSEISRETLLGLVRRIWEERDPVPDDLVARIQAAVAAETSDLDLELLELVERNTELAGARGSTALTLRFVQGPLDLLLRVAGEDDGSRVDGWVVPPEPMTVRAVREDDETHVHEAVATGDGRFELVGLPTGRLRLQLEPDDLTRPVFATPIFEI